MRKVFALYAPANHGKTTTLNILIDLLCIVADSYNVWRDREGWGWFVINGVTVGVCTPGDNQDVIKNNIRYFNENGCEIVVTASRSKGGGVKEIEKLEKKEKAELEWIEKEDSQKLNKLIASDIFRKILNEVYPKEEQI